MIQMDKKLAKAIARQVARELETEVLEYLLDPERSLLMLQYPTQGLRTGDLGLMITSASQLSSFDQVLKIFGMPPNSEQSRKFSPQAEDDPCQN